MREFRHTVVIQAPPAAVLDAFFDAEALAIWWQVSRAVCVPRLLGNYFVEWEPTGWRDDTLGRLGGVFRGTVLELKPGREFFVADAFWLPPDGNPIGPMALEVTCSVQRGGTELRVRQSGCDAGNARWVRYYDVIASGWTRALESLKTHLEDRWADCT